MKRRICSILQIPPENKLDLERAQSVKDKLIRQQSNLIRQVKKQEMSLKNTPKPERLGNQYVHALEGERLGQFSASLCDQPNNGPGAARVVFDLKESKGDGPRVKISGVDYDHNYKNFPEYGKVPVPELQEVEPFYVHREEEDDEKESNEAKKKKQ